MKKLILLLAFLFIVPSFFYLLDQRQQAIVLQFGEAMRVVRDPGLQFKVPFIQNVVLFDKRILNVWVDDKEVITSDQKRLIVNAFAKYRITDPLKFYQSVRDQDGISRRINAILDSSLRQALGNVTLPALLSSERSNTMQKITVILREQSKAFGVDVIDVRITRADLPQENSLATYERMITDRRQDAEMFRAEGNMASEIIKAEADRQYKIIIADAARDAQIIRGEGDAEAIEIYAASYNKDPDFFDFYRSLEAYKKTLQSKNTTILLSPNHGFLNHFSLGGK